MNDIKKSLYQSALEGTHPDLNQKAKWIRHPSESVNRAINLCLRDVFTPLCEQMCSQVKQVNAQDIHQIAAGVKIHKNVYHDMIFEEETSPFIEGYQTVSKLPDINTRRKEPLFQEWEKCYNQLSPPAKKYYRYLLAHTKNVAALERYGLSNIVCGRYKYLLWAPIDDYSPTMSQAVDTTVVPIGSYGENLAQKMLLTTNVLAKLTDKFFAKTASIVEKINWDLVINETARGREKQQAIFQTEQACHWSLNSLKNNNVKNIYQQQKENFSLCQKEAIRTSVLDSLKEALQSVQAALSSFVPEKMENFSDEECLLKVIESGLPLQFAKIVPFGYTLPVIRRGRFFEEMIVCSEKNTLQFNRDFCEKARQLKHGYLETRVYEDGKRNPGFLGFGCPAAIKKKQHKQTGIRYVLDAYKHIFLHL